MARRAIPIGTVANDRTGVTNREAWEITNENFQELYADASDLTEDMAVLDAEFSGLNENVNNINSDLGEIDADISDLNEEVGTKISQSNKAVSFTPANGVNLTNEGGVIYSQYTQSGALELTIAADSIIGGWAILPITVDGATITVTGATKDPKSNDASSTATDVDRYVFWKDTMGVWYSITNLG